MGRILQLACLAIGCIAAPVGAEELGRERLQYWHQWRGPDATGVAPLADPPVEWGPGKNIKWQVELPGYGNSTPIVWGDRVFITTAMQTDRVDENREAPEDQPERPFGIVYPNHYFQFIVVCLDRATGKTLWQRVAAEQVPHEGHHPDNTFASASPTTDGEHVYASFGSQGVYCYDVAGRLKWKRDDLGKLETRLSFGDGSSPVLHGDSLILNRDHEGQSFIVVLDKATGKTRWQRDRDEQSSWSTPLVVEHNGHTQIVTSASHRVRSYDLKSGELLWECGGQVGNVSPSPVAAEGTVFCMSGYRGSALQALSLEASGDISDSDKILWQRDRDTPYVPSPLLYDNLLYYTKSNNAILSCIDIRTGEQVMDATRLPELRALYASPVGAAGRIYIVGRDGTTLVIRRGTELEVLAVNELDDPMDASPAVAGNQLFLRSKTRVYCVEQQ